MRAAVGIVVSDAGNKESDQLAARQLLQQRHEDASILDVLEKILDLDGRVTLKMEWERGKQDRRGER